MARPPTSQVLAIDIGSSSLRTALFTERGVRIVESTAVRQYSFRYTVGGGAELDAAVLLRAARACLHRTVRARVDPIAAVAGSAFWHGLLGLDRTGRPITPIYTWADNRSVADAAQLRRDFREREIQLRTGCMLRAPFWPAKLLWLRRTDSALFRRVRRWTSPAHWIFAQLFGASSTSHSMASGTGLYNLKQHAWDTELCEYSRIDHEQLDQIDDRPTATCKTLPDAQIFPAIGDGGASNLGSGAATAGRIAINIGTSAAVRAIVPERAWRAGRLPAGLFSYVLDEERLVIGGAISNAGNLRAWCLRELRLSAEIEATLSRVGAANDTLTVLPYLVSERAPTWPELVRGTFGGVTSVTSAAEIFRAATTATFYRLADILNALESAVARVDELIISGGVLKSEASLRLLADCLARDIHVCREPESSLRGAAIHALERLGHKVTPLRAGRVVRHHRALAEKHRARRREQAALERRFA